MLNVLFVADSGRVVLPSISQQKRGMEMVAGGTRRWSEPKICMFRFPFAAQSSWRIGGNMDNRSHPVCFSPNIFGFRKRKGAIVRLHAEKVTLVLMKGEPPPGRRPEKLLPPARSTLAKRSLCSQSVLEFLEFCCCQTL